MFVVKDCIENNIDITDGDNLRKTLYDLHSHYEHYFKYIEPFTVSHL